MRRVLPEWGDHTDGPLFLLFGFIEYAGEYHPLRTSHSSHAQI